MEGETVQRRAAVGGHGPAAQYVSEEPGYAYVLRRAPGPGKTGTLVPAHAFKTRAPLIDTGDPFNARNIVHDGDFYQQGKPWSDPGRNVNLYTNVAQLNSIMQPFFGFISKLRILRQPSRIVRGQQRALGEDVNIEAPPAAAYGDFATYTANQRIHTAMRG